MREPQPLPGAESDPLMPIHHTTECILYQDEVTFPRAHIEGWLKRGVFPPPLLGAHDSMSSVYFILAARELWDAEGSPLDGLTDEQGVERQQAHCAAMIAAARRALADDGDPLVICNCPRDPPT